MQFKQLFVLLALAVAGFAADSSVSDSASASASSSASDSASASSVSDESVVVSTLSATRIFNTVLPKEPFLTIATETVTWIATFTPSASDDASATPTA
ncbi:hypothetical protein NLI96_g4638 [Meripilus lineatus]|uniref:Uncharacterized protein n=1 Tax=Meripilus lineatus TaxID=2056292 RepID=A0AAD5YEL3_9APHY|nr:hypothetical protein NLI96_g4638 [Physisporinus lineatus]